MFLLRVLFFFVFLSLSDKGLAPNVFEKSNY